MLDILQNEFIIKNVSNFFLVVLFAFLVSFILTPFIGRLAKSLGAIDKPKNLRLRTERGFDTRIHSEPKLKLGGISIIISIVLGVLIFQNSDVLGNVLKINFESIIGIVLGILVIMVLGILDDIYEISAIKQLTLQILAAVLAIFFSVGTIDQINFLNISINLSLVRIPIQIGILQEIYLVSLLFTIFWIVGIINIINWVGGVDGLNGSVTSTVLVTLAFITLSNGNIPISLLIALHLGGVLGVLPYNYYPSKIFYGSVGDYLNGYLLAIFALLSGTKWSSTLILLSLPIIDAIYVVYLRFRKYPQYLKTPWKILSISDRNHLHHRLLDSGFSQKAVMQIELSITFLLCLFALFTTDLRSEVLAFIGGLVFLSVFLSIVLILKHNYQKKTQFYSIITKAFTQDKDSKPIKPKVKIVFQKENQEDEKNQREEKFIY